MPQIPLPPHESGRLAALQRYNILDTEPEPAFDDIATLAAFCCQTPIAAINFVAEQRVWSKAAVGLPTNTIPRNLSVCSYTVAGSELCIIPDATVDSRLVDHPLVTQQPSLRFYAGVPLVTPDGYAIGTLCVMDFTPHTISPEQQAALQALARQVTTQLELRHSVSEMQRAAVERQAAESELRKSQQALALFVEQTLFPVVSVDTNFHITEWNPAAEKVFHLTRAEVLGRHPSGLLFPETYAQYIEESRQAILTNKQTAHGPAEIVTRDGRTLICEWYVTPLVDLAGEVIGITAIAQEITEAIRTTKALQASEDRFRTLFEASPLGICITRDGEWLYANPAAFALIGANRDDQNVSHSFLDYVAPQSHALQLERIQKCKQGEFTPSAYEIIAKRLDGSYFPLHVQTCAVTLQDGPAVIAFMNDVTEGKQAKIELENSLALLRATLESTTDGILVVDLAGNILNTNQKFGEMWRIPEAMLAICSSSQALDFVLEQVADPINFQTKANRLCEELDAASFDELRLTDGRIFELYSQPVRMAGESVGRVWCFRDVSERRQVEAALRQSEALARDIIDNSTLRIFVKSLDGRYLLVNREWEKNSGFTLNQVKGKTNYDLFPQTLVDRYHTWDQKLIESGKTLATEDHSAEADGVHVYSCLRSLLYDEAGQPYAIIGVSTDITEHRQLEEQLQQTQKMEAIGRLAGGVAHDFNNILTTIYSACTLARRRLADDAPARRYIDEMQKAAERAAALTQQLLAFSRKQVVQTRVLSLYTLLLNMEEMLKRLVGERVQINLRLAPNLAAIQADPSQMEQVLLNLAANARDAMPNGGSLTISADNIHHRSSDELTPQPTTHPYVRLTVVDSGEGVDPATLPYIFEPFFTTKVPGKGTGLGLATVYGIVRQNGGEIQVESQLGQGTTVQILLPAVDAPPQSDSGSTNSVAPAQGTETVLLVEDQESVRRTTVEILTMHGYRVLAASGAEEALQIYTAHLGTIDLLLTDMVMPVTSGSELATHLRTFQPGLKVLFMSGHTEDEGVMLAARNEQLAFLQKPFTLATLLQKLRTVLEG